MMREAASGDTLYSIAEESYGDPQYWAEIYFANQPLMSGRNMTVRAGDVLFVPCLSEPEGDAALAMAAGGAATLGLPADLPPLAARGWRGDGLLGDLVAEAFAAAADPLPIAVARGGDADMLLLRSDEACPGDCADMLVSGPLLTLPVMRWTRTGDATEGGLCDAAQDGLRACLDRLAAGTVGAMAADALSTGALVVHRGLRGALVADPEPLRTVTFRIAVPRDHWRGTTLIYRLNAGLAALRDTGRYDRLIRRHMQLYRQQYASTPG